MANWLNQLQSLLGQKGSSASSSGEQGLSKLLVPGALGGLAGLLVANKSSRKLLSYGTSTRIKFAQRIRMSRSLAHKAHRWMSELNV